MHGARESRNPSRDAKPVMPRRDPIASEFRRLNKVVLIDCEFTCWEDSLRTNWPDPSRPPELIEIALAEYKLQDAEIGGTFTSLVRPLLNPKLSAYCRELNRIAQEETDTAPLLPDVLQRVDAWLSGLDLGNAPICEWGNTDLLFIARDASRHGCATPFQNTSHIPLNAIYQRIVRPEVFRDGERDTMRHHFGLGANPGRHRALPDALDLARFCAHLRQVATGA